MVTTTTTTKTTVSVRVRKEKNSFNPLNGVLIYLQFTTNYSTCIKKRTTTTTTTTKTTTTMNNSSLFRYKFTMSFWIYVVMILMIPVSAVDQQQQKEQTVLEAAAVDNSNNNGDMNNDNDPSSKTCSNIPQNDAGTGRKDCSADQEEQETQQAIQDVIDYVRENDGYINEKLKIYRPPGSAVRGIYTMEELEKDEIICELPWKLLISPENKHLYFDVEYEVEDKQEDSDEEANSDEEKYDEEEEGQSESQTDLCDSIDMLYVDMKYNLTAYGRFLRYHQPYRYIPSLWTEGGKMVYRDILDPDGKPHYFDQVPLFCELDSEVEENQLLLQDELWIHADMLIKARADDWYLTPFYDMTNHRNGPKYYNTHHIVDYGKTFTLTTNRRIMAGEQIYNSYNDCNKCDSRRHDYDTAQMFMDYGFVEDYPRFFLIESVRLKFRIHEEEEDEVRESPNENNNDEIDNASTESTTPTTTTKRVEFALPPSDLGVTYLEKEIERLEEFKNDNMALWMIDDDDDGKRKDVTEIRYKGIVLKQSELDAVLSLYDAFVSDYKLAIEAAKGKTSSAVWVECDPSEWWYTENYEEEGC
mmetsp:Transcript_28700/g.44093  ORF Transcript_28700/g.44093 Transcript_28700/m.44093 type:complete len:585 (-) Transcript_28700:109-1863(-)